MRVLIGKFERIFVVEAFLDKSSFVLIGQKIAGHLMGLIFTTGHVVMR